MIQSVLTGPNAPFLWLDVVEPTRDELATLAQTYGLHLTSVEDSLQPEHLPKHETIDGAHFMILRAIDENASVDAVTVQDLTRKLALFVNDKVIISIHRRDQPYIARVRQSWSNRPIKAHSLPHIVNDLVRGVVDTYVRPIADLQTHLEIMEASIFRAAAATTLVTEAYTVRRRAAVYRHMMRLTSDIIANLAQLPKASRPFFQDVKETCDRLKFYADDISANTDNILNLHLALQAQKTNVESQRANEVMQVLTVFSAFFLPLSFIAGVYGMNFKVMPELDSPHGYYGALLAMALVALGIYLWFRRKGWIGRGKRPTP